MNTLIKALAQAMNFSSLSTPTAPHWVKGSGLGGFQLVQFARYLGFKSEAEIPELEVEMLADCWKAASCTWAFHIVSVLRLLLFLPYIPSFQESDSLATSIHTRRIGAIQMLFLVSKQKCLHSCIFCKKTNPAVPPNRCQESPSCRVAKIFGEARENRTWRPKAESSSLVLVVLFVFALLAPCILSERVQPMYFLEKTLQSDPIKLVST